MRKNLKNKLLSWGIAHFLVGCPMLFAGEASLSSEELCLKFPRFVDDITSFQFTEVMGEADDFTNLTWQEAGVGYRLEEWRSNKTKPRDNWHELFSYDGAHGYRFIPPVNRLYIQKAPFTAEDANYNACIRGPLLGFEFLLTKSHPRENIRMLADEKYLVSVSERMSAKSKDEVTHGGHPCVEVRVVDGYNRWNDEDADYTVYLATDLGFYPVAWEMYNKQGTLRHTYEIKELATIPVPGKESEFRYPSDAVFGNAALPGREERLKFTNVEINTLTLKDMALDPTLGDSVEDRDTHKLTTVPK